MFLWDNRRPIDLRHQENDSSSTSANTIAFVMEFVTKIRKEKCKHTNCMVFLCLHYARSADRLQCSAHCFFSIFKNVVFCAFEALRVFLNKMLTFSCSWEMPPLRILSQPRGFYTSATPAHRYVYWFKWSGALPHRSISLLCIEAQSRFYYPQTSWGGPCLVIECMLQRFIYTLTVAWFHLGRVKIDNCRTLEGASSEADGCIDIIRWVGDRGRGRASVWWG